MNVPGQPLPPRRESGTEERIEVRRYLSALRRSAGLIAAIVVVITGAVLAISLSLANTYTATARIVFEETTSVLGASDSESIQRRLATTEQLLTSRRVRDAAAEKLPGGRLDGDIESSVDQTANIINVIGSAEDADRAAAIANAVSD